MYNIDTSKWRLPSVTTSVKLCIWIGVLLYPVVLYLGYGNVGGAVIWSLMVVVPWLYFRNPIRAARTVREWTDSTNALSRFLQRRADVYMLQVIPGEAGASSGRAVLTKAESKEFAEIVAHWDTHQ